MNYQELLKSHQENFTKGGNPEFHSLCRRIDALAYSLTGEKVEGAKTIVVTKSTIVRAAAKIGFEFDGKFTVAAYESALEFLGNHILNPNQA